MIGLLEKYYGEENRHEKKLVADIIASYDFILFVLPTASLAN